MPHTYTETKLHPRANKFQNKTYHSNSPATQEHSPVPLPAVYASVSSSWLYCCVWGGLSVFWQFVEFSLLWGFLAVGGFVWVACQGFLVREACISVLVGGAGFLLSGVQ